MNINTCLKSMCVKVNININFSINKSINMNISMNIDVHKKKLVEIHHL